MKMFVALLVLAAAVSADRLDNTYLPPNSAKTAGGNGNILNAPAGGRQGFGGGFGASGSGFGASAGGAASGGFSANAGFANNGYSGAQSASSANVDSRFAGQQQQQQQQERGPFADAAILKFESENNGDGSYRFEYETDNQIQHQESGELKNAGSEQEAQSVQGSYSYMGPDNVLYTVTYIADENGFRATGDHIPTPPPIPEAILKSIEQNAAEESNNGYQQNGNGYQQNGNGYQQNGNGYQQNGNGYQQNRNGYQQNGNGYQQTGNGYQQNNIQKSTNGFQNSNDGISNRFQNNQGSSSAASRQYLAPNKPAFNQQSGYQY